MRGESRVSLGVDKFSFWPYNVYIVDSENERETIWLHLQNRLKK